MFFKYVVVINLFAFYGSFYCSSLRPDFSKRLTAHTEFAKKGLVTKHVRKSQYYYFSISEAKIRIARTYYLNLIYFCRKYTIFTRFYEFMLQKVLKFANYAVAKLVLKIMLSCSNYAKNYASTIRQCLGTRAPSPPPPAPRSLTQNV